MFKLIYRRHGEPLAAIKKKLLFVMLAVAILITVALAASGCQSGGIIKPEALQQALLQDSIVKKGVASEQYLNASVYELTACEVSDIKEVSKELGTANVSAVIENENYVTELNLSVECEQTYPDDKKEPTPKYKFSVISSNTTPKKGIDFDESHNLSDCDAVLAEDGKSCIVNKEEKLDLWFADSTVKNSYSYLFNSQGYTGWVFEELDTIHTVSYKNIDGSYLAKTGDLTDFVKFEISNLEPNKGSFTINYTIDKPSSGSISYEVINGTMEAMIDPKQNGQNPFKDGYAYYFEARGTSDRGRGSASCEGYLTISDGSPCIEISGGSVDYTYHWSLANEPKDDTAPLATGMMFKQ